MVTSEGVVGCKDAWTGAPLAMTLQAAPLSLAVSPMSMVSLSLGPGAMNAWAEELGVSMTGEELAAFDLFDSSIASADMLVAMSVTARVAALADATGQVIDTTKTQTAPGRRLALTSLDGSNAYDVIAQLIIGSEEEGCEDTLYGQAGGRSLTSDDADEMGGCIQKMLTEPAVRHGGGSVCDACTPDSCDNCLCLSADNCLSADQVQALNSLIKKAFDVAVDQTSTATDVLSMQEAVAKSAAAVTVKQTDPPEGLDARQHKSILEAIEEVVEGTMNLKEAKTQVLNVTIANLVDGTPILYTTPPAPPPPPVGAPATAVAAVPPPPAAAPEEESNVETDDFAVGLGVGIPGAVLLLCCFLTCWLHRASGGSIPTYLRVTFAHSNPNIVFMYLPEETKRKMQAAIVTRR